MLILAHFAHITRLIDTLSTPDLGGIVNLVWGSVQYNLRYDG